jgi:hypothetical protein
MARARARPTSRGPVTETLLHLFTRAALRVMGPRAAFELVTRVARPLAPLEPSPASLTRLGRQGSCLSRSISLASRMRGARVAVGVKKSGYRAVGATRYGLRGRDAIAAHAWIEVNGQPIDEHDQYGKVIAYLEVERGSTVRS